MLIDRYTSKGLRQKMEIKTFVQEINPKWKFN